MHTTILWWYYLKSILGLYFRRSYCLNMFHAYRSCILEANAYIFLNGIYCAYISKEICARELRGGNPWLPMVHIWSIMEYMCIEMLKSMKKKIIVIWSIMEHVKFWYEPNTLTRVNLIKFAHIAMILLKNKTYMLEVC